MKISLVHNPTAGDGQDVDDVVKLLTDAGHEVRHRSSKGDWKKLLQDPGDIVVAAGGDGTVRKVAVAAAERGLSFAILPIGTANNIAKTLGLVGDARALVRSWSDEASEARPFDIGEVTAGEESRRFVEAAGGGWFAELIAHGAKVEDELLLVGRETDRALHLLAALLRRTRPMAWQVLADGEDLSGDYLAVEVANVRFVGPNVPLAIDADPSDGLFDVVLVSEADRGPVVDYLEGRHRLASGVMPPLRTVRASHVRLVAPAGVRFHVDDGEWPADGAQAAPMEVDVHCIAGAATLR
jgi:diacylglycerol kinase (ATP)